MRFFKFTFILCTFSLFSFLSFGQAGEFIENQGQWDAPFQYKATTPNADFFLRKDGIKFLLSDKRNSEFFHDLKHGKVNTSYSPRYHAYDLLFVGANPDPTYSATKPQKHYYNYYLGSNPSRWKSKIHPSLSVDYNTLYNGIDMHIYLNNQNVKYDYIVHAKADYRVIKWKYNGLDKLELSKEGNLILHTSIGENKELKPFAYQMIDGERKEIKSTYQLIDGIVSFKILQQYDDTKDLIIDPTIEFCSFTGSTADNWGFTATYDSLGNFYAGGIVIGNGGTSLSGNYPIFPSVGAIQPNYGGGSGAVPTDCTVSKFNTNGSSLIYSTYFGGAENDQPHSLIVDNAGNLVIAGRTFSPQNSFPITSAAADPTYNGGGDLFVAKFNAAGTVNLGCTYVGGSNAESVNVDVSGSVIGGLKHNYADDARSEVIVDANDNIYVATCTRSTDFPLVNSTLLGTGGSQDAAIIQLNPTLTTLLWSCRIGGTSDDAAYVLSINKINPLELFVAGGTSSAGFPTTGGTWQSAYQGGTADGFLMKFNSNTKALLTSTFVGTNSYDQVFGIQTDDSNHVYAVGQTTGNYPIIGSGVWSVANSSQFITKFNNNLSTPIYSTVFGKGTNNTTDISINAFLVDKCDNVYVSGWGGPIIPTNPGNTTGLPITSGTALQSTTDGSDYYFIVLSKNFQSLVYGSFFGQNGGNGEHVDGGTSRFDKNGIIYQAMCARCANSTTPASVVFPTTPGVWSPNNQATNCNLAAVKIRFNFQNPKAQAVIVGDSVGCAPLTINFTNNSLSASNFVWDFGDGNQSTSINPTHIYTTPGNYVVTLFAYNPDGCTATSDTSTMNITVKADSILPLFNVIKVDSCDPFTATFVNLSTTNTGGINPGTTYSWDFGDGTTFNGPNPPIHSFPTSSAFTITLTIIDTNACNSPAVFTRVVNYSTSLVSAAFDMPDSVCLPAKVNFNNQSVSSTTWNWNFGDGNTSTSQNPTNEYTLPGTYSIFLLSGNPLTCNKFDSVTKTITILTSPIADFNWSPNPPEANKATEFKNLSAGATSYLWDFGDGSTSTQKDEIHIYQKDGTYNVCLTAKNEVGCVDTVCKPVRGVVIPLADVPTGFSPNGDGNNDFVFVKGYGIDKLTFRIFNRWGEKIFETKDKKVGWDGKYKGVLQEMETYQYTLSVDFFDGTRTFKKGNITLLR